MKHAEPPQPNEKHSVQAPYHMAPGPGQQSTMPLTQTVVRPVPLEHFVDIFLAYNVAAGHG